MRLSNTRRSQQRSCGSVEVTAGQVVLLSTDRKAGICVTFDSTDEKIKFALSILGKVPALELSAHPDARKYARLILANDTPVDWRKSVPDCLIGDIEDAKDLPEAVHLAVIQLDLIQEGQDGTESYSKKDIAAIKRWIKNNKGD